MTDLKWLPDDLWSPQLSGASFYTFIFKIASRCNLNCDYCYVYRGPDQSWKERPKFMSDATARQAFRRIAHHVEEMNLDSITIALHGGEALLAGTQRIRSYLESAKEIIPCDIEFTSQTNGTIVTSEILELFSEFDVTMGMSIDGAKSINDRHRRFHNGKSSFERVMRSIELINSNPDWSRLLTGYLAVIDIDTDPDEVFTFLSGIDNRGFDILLPLANYETPPPRPDWDQNKISYGIWLAAFYDSWMKSGKDVQVRYFDEIISLLFGYNSSMENIGATYVDLIVIETDGSIEPVDTLKTVGRAATSMNLNVYSNSLSEALYHPAVYSRLIGHDALCKTCKECNFLQQCGGGYIPHRYSRSDGFVNPSVYCNDIKFLITHIKESLMNEL